MRKLLVGFAAFLFATSAFAQTYGFQTSGKGDAIENITVEATENSVYGLYDTYGVTGGIAAGVTIDVTSTGNSWGGYGAYFYGASSSSPIDYIGAIDGVVKIAANGSSSHGDVRGLVFDNAQQKPEAGIGGQIIATNSNLERNVTGVIVQGNSSMGDISSSGVIRATNYYSSGSSTGLLVADSSYMGIIFGKIIAEAAGTAIGVSMMGDNSDLFVRGSAYIEANSRTDGRAYAVFRSGSLNVWGDYWNTQTFKGDFSTYWPASRSLTPTAYDMTFKAGKFVFDNHNSSTGFYADNGSSNIIFMADVQADFVKSAYFRAKETSLGANFIFHAKTAGHYTNMSTDRTGGTVYIEDGASFLMLLDRDFTANAGDYLDLLLVSVGVTVDGYFGENNISVAYENALANLIYGLDYTVDHNPESGVYGRITFLRDIVIPEPSACAAIFGAAVFAFAACRRRK